MLCHIHIRSAYGIRHTVYMCIMYTPYTHIMHWYTYLHMRTRHVYAYSYACRYVYICHIHTCIYEYTCTVGEIGRAHV